MNRDHDHDSDDSISEWLDGLPRNDAASQNEIWRRYADRVTRLARRLLHGVQRRDADEEDIAVQVLQNLYQRMREGSVRPVNRAELWSLLSGMTVNKAREMARGKLAQKRGGGKVRGESGFFDEDDSDRRGIEQCPDPSLSAEEFVSHSEQFSQMMDCLENDELRRVVLLRLAGYSNKEIAAALQCAERTIERKLQLIRQMIRHYVGDQ